MKTIKISQKNFQKISRLYNDYLKIYGNEDTIWDLDDLEEMREIGQEFMDVFINNFKQK